MLRSRGWSYCLFWKQGYGWELRQEWPEEQPMALPPAVLLAARASSLQVHGHTLVTCCSCKRCQDSPGCLEILLSLLPQPCFMSVSRVGPEHQWYLENTLGESCHRGCLSLSHKEPVPTPHSRMGNGLLNKECLLTIGVKLSTPKCPEKMSLESVALILLYCKHVKLACHEEACGPPAASLTCLLY